MKRCINSSRSVSIAVLATAVVTLSGSVFAQSVDQVLQAELRRLNLAQQSQERINNIVEGTRSLEDQYRAINKEIDGLRVYNRLMSAQTEGQKAVLEDIALSMDQVDVINRQIFPLMQRMIDVTISEHTHRLKQDKAELEKIASDPDLQASMARRLHSKMEVLERRLLNLSAIDSGLKRSDLCEEAA